MMMRCARAFAPPATRPNRASTTSASSSRNSSRTHAISRSRCWAIEERVYAEDPLRNFLPSIGRLTRYREPIAGRDVRIDSGVYEGAEISVYYDPMIAKLIGYGEDRRRATAAISAALDAYQIRGVSHNISFLSALLRHPRFVAGRLTTGFIAEEFPDGFQGAKPSEEECQLLAAVAAVV